MNILVLGTKGSFDFKQIGGTDSFFRRLALQLIEWGHRVQFIHYGACPDAEERPCDGLTIYYRSSFADALKCIAARDGPVLVNMIYRWDRVRFARFRRGNPERHFYFVASWYSESWIRRHLYFLEAALWPYSGGVLCMSPRLAKEARGLRNKAYVLFPPVPENYYTPPEDKPSRRELTVTFMGRTVRGKGADLASAVFNRLQGERDIVTRVYGYVWGDGREDLSIHEDLCCQRDIDYRWERYKGWSPRVDERVAEVLRKTDILLLPYRRLSSTIDTPLVLLEGMAACCSVITTPLGDIPRIYGASPFLLSRGRFVSEAVRLIKTVRNSREHLYAERQRVWTQCTRLKFSTKACAERLITILSGR